LALWLALAASVLRSGWLCDDAYITFRTVDNFVSGYGPVWNTGERVQAYTHPLWMLLLSALYGITGEIYFTSILLGVALTLATAFLLGARLARDPWLGILALATLLLSKAFVDFSTSGLENPLSHLLLVTALTLHFRREPSPGLLGLQTLLLSLGMLTRLDNALIFGPLVGWVGLELARSQGWRACLRSAWRPSLAGLSPLLAWEVFSLLYYGFALPNSAYAKLGTGIALHEYLEQGVLYLVNSLLVDPVTLFAISAGLGLTFASRDPRRMACGLGIALHLLYVVRVGGDFMSGRFLTVPLVASVALLARLEAAPERRFAAGFAALAALLTVAAGFPSLGDAYASHLPDPGRTGIRDAREAHLSATGVAQAGRRMALPRHPWAQRGRELRASGTRVTTVGGAGFVGFFAGPDVHLVDVFALGDPLLARLPSRPSPLEETWRIGHFRRRLPEGYLASLPAEEIAIRDPALAEYYAHLRLVTRGEIFSPPRLITLLKLNLGAYDRLLEAYARDEDD
jgi:arabinofuranosyltransferase